MISSNIAVYVYVCMYVYACMYVCMYMCTYVCMYVYKHMCVCVGVCTCMYMLLGANQIYPSRLRHTFCQPLGRLVEDCSQLRSL